MSDNTKTSALLFENLGSSLLSGRPAASGATANDTAPVDGTASLQESEPLGDTVVETQYLAPATTFPDSVDEELLGDESANALTLLPTAEYSDDELSDEEGVGDIFSSLNSLLPSDRAPSQSQFAQFQDARVVSDPRTGQARLESAVEYQLSEADTMQFNSENALWGGESQDDNDNAVFSAKESFDAYQQALQKQARVDELTAKRQKIEHMEVSPEPSALPAPVPAAGTSKVPLKGASKYALPPETGDFITSRTSTGKALYFGVRSELDMAKRMERVADTEGQRMGTATINRVVGDIENDLDTEAALRASEMDMDHVGTAPGAKIDHNSTRLWVDKYRARSFVDLVSDERTNRAVLQWLKEWDYCVFGRENKSRLEERAANTDKWQRPAQRILLLSGPPGLGKTTLAHVAARQAGYDVVEINASDDRTVSRVRDRVLGVTQTHAVRLDGSTRPQLLIIDEIDGVSGAAAMQGDFIGMLAGLVSQEDTPRKGRRRNIPLRRPIICICNNVYAPALRPLRQIAQCFTVNAPTAARLAQRLADVCLREKINADQWALLELAKQNEGDMRASINALQMASQRRARVDADSIKRGAIGRKDMQRSLFSLWAMIFTKPDASSLAFSRSALGKRTAHGTRAHGPQVDREYAKLLLDNVRSSGELERLMQGCFENYLRMGFRDLTHTRVAALCTDWLEFYDHVDSAVRRTPATADAISAYREFALLAMHRTCSTPLGLSRGDFEYPHSEYDAFQARSAAHGVLQTLASSPLNVRSCTTPAHAATELLDPLLHILSPQLVTSNLHLLKGDEKARMMRLVEVMDSWKLTLVQERDVNSQFIYRLEPPIDRIYAFSGRRPQRPILTMRYPVRQLVAQELERVRLARLMAGQMGIAESTDSRDTAKREYLARLFADPLADSSALTKPAAAAEPVLRDFFGRKITKAPAPNPTNGKKAADKEAPPRVWFHFFEGFSNAVRKPTQISELF
ncbi:Chromosome transmission fidelity protein 18 [Coemansia sp. RSA 2711]|nr:Chromosome transmission fidelity protein 18 [Coemansia sp. RSA 2711]